MAVYVRVERNQTKFRQVQQFISPNLSLNITNILIFDTKLNADSTYESLASEDDRCMIVGDEYSSVDEDFDGS